MKILIIITLMLSTLLSMESKGDGTLDLRLDSTKDSVEGGLRYVYSFSTIMGDPRVEFKAQWSITKVHFSSIKDVGEDITYGVCQGVGNSSCIPEEIMEKAAIAKLSLRGSGGTIGAGYSYVFDAGAMSKPKVYEYNMDGYGKMSNNTPESSNWSKTFYVDGYKRNTFPIKGDTSKYHNKETAKNIVRMGIDFSSFKIEKITFNLWEIRAYIEKRTREAKEVEEEYEKLIAKDKKQNEWRVSEAQKIFRETESSRALVDQFKKDRQDKVEKEEKLQRERQAREEMETELERERLIKEEREAQRRVASSKDVFVDNNTGLMWQDYNKVNSAYISNLNWMEAKDYCQNLSWAGRSDWYLPDKSQLIGLYQKKSRLKYVYSGGYWSSTTDVGKTSKAWDVYFYDGKRYYDYKDGGESVRCVRDRQ